MEGGPSTKRGAGRTDVPARPPTAAVAGPQNGLDLLGHIRRILLALVQLGIIGLGVELVLLEHTETVWQWLPLVALAAGFLAAAGVTFRPTRLTLRLFRTMMLVFVAAGVAGLYLHYDGNVAFELEMYPDIGGLELFRKALQGATPTLAPGALAQLGLLGLTLTLRHPALRRARRTKEER